MTETKRKRPKGLQGKKFFIETLGCSKNLVDSEFMAGELMRQGCLQTSEVDEADYLILNTCGFIGDAMEESVNAILELGALKKPGQKLVAAGCLSERFAEELAEEIPELDMIVGVARFLELPEMLLASEGDGSGSGNMRVGEIDRYVDYCPTERVLMTPGFYAYVKISEGCDNACTYCTIPSFKGRNKSRTMEAIEEEVRDLSERGVKEIILIAQDTTKYGKDLYGRCRLPDLLERLAGVEGIEWIRILYAYPDIIDRRLIETIRKHKKICRYLDMPIQHCHDGILKAMNRHTSSRDLDALLNMIREVIPEMAIRTTLMVGFPGETEEAFEALMAFVERQKFDKLGVFQYSPEAGTPSARFENQVHPDIKEERHARIMALQREISTKAQQERVGELLRVMIEEKVPDEAVYIGRTEYDAPEVDGVVYIHTEKNLQPGTFIPVRITDALEYDLIGEIEHDASE